jgi:hypothetical protein
MSQKSRRPLAFALLTTAAFAGAIGFACDDNSGDTLALGAYNGGNGNPIGSLGGKDATALTPAQVAEALYRALESDLVKTCGGPCHGTGTAPGNPPVWLAPPDTYVSVKAFPGAITPDPNESRILNHGSHAGPSLLSGTYKPLGDRVFAWLQQEAIVLTLKQLPSTDPFTVTTGANSIDISKGETDGDGGATALTGAKITFTAAKSGTIMELSKITVAAPAATGMRIAHPIFVVVPAMGANQNDPVDTFSTVDLTLASAESAPLGTGDLFLFKWDDTNKMKIAFTTLEPATPPADAGMTTGGCKSVTTYTSSAVPEIQKDGCLGCHAGSNGNATSALDMTQVGKDNTMACAQALNKVTLTNKPQSPIIQAPAGNLTHTGGKVADTAAYTTALLGWINNE